MCDPHGSIRREIRERKVRIADMLAGFYGTDTHEVIQAFGHQHSIFHDESAVTQMVTAGN